MVKVILHYSLHLDTVRKYCKSSQTTGKGKWQTYYLLKDRFANITRSYAITTYKSQGSTYSHSFVNYDDMKFLKRQRLLMNQSLYVACTRASKNLYIYSNEDD